MAVDLGYDESGEGDVLVVSMRIGLTEKVRRMSKLWKKELNRVGIPFFHSKDYDNYISGVFKNVSRRRRGLLLERLAQMARLRLEIGITTTISHSQFMAMTDNDWRSKWATPYSFAVAMLTLSAQIYVEHMNLGYDVNILVESGHRNVGQVLEIMKTLAETPKLPGINPLKILRYGLGSKKDHPILQAADMLAFSEWQSLINGDREIWDALHVNGSRYTTELFDSMKQVPTMLESTRTWEEVNKRWKREQKTKQASSTNSTTR